MEEHIKKYQEVKEIEEPLLVRQGVPSTYKKNEEDCKLITQAENENYSYPNNEFLLRQRGEAMQFTDTETTSKSFYTNSKSLVAISVVTTALYLFIVYLIFTYR